MAHDIAVVGSANLDIVVPVSHHPVPGETVLGGDHAQIPGGKGANQAVASARLGSNVAFVGCIGADAAGAALLESLSSAGVDTSGLRTIEGVPSGIALITVGPDGDNAIVVSPGANARLTPGDVQAEAARLDCAVTQLQLEIPLETTLAAARTATGLVLLDPAPAPLEGLPRELLDEVDIVAPNETELALLVGRDVDPTDLPDLVDAGRSLLVQHVVVTLGSRGALVISDGVVTEVPAPAVQAVDTTAAGDAFRSALATCLAKGQNLVEASSYAVRVGAATTLRFGAQPSLPTVEEVDELLS